MGSATRRSFNVKGLPLSDGDLFAYDETDDFRFGINGGEWP